ncbi:hypothetical protein DM02DRAFT_316596 [Periconia macrospinosa]|uniref:DUF7708 domain-containing protein n=1 Tax=Periconia macrospinosa TaxID=97972 RepID=A0A2V1DVQ2_9PLEO|nr:hypothetical protein DM02DRAFT_316596 [Periconia macrospinosa]
MLAASQLSHPSPGATKGESLWKKAFDALDTNLQATLSVCNKPKLNILHQVLLQVENARQTCIRKQWRVKAPGGKTIILRDVVEKMAGWINRFKEVGTVAVQYDPLHGALPWAAFVFLLNVTLGDVQLFASLVTDLESIAFVLYRCGFYEKLYINTSTTTVDPLKESLVHLYAEILTHLSMSIKYFHKNTGSEY